MWSCLEVKAERCCPFEKACIKGTKRMIQEKDFEIFLNPDTDEIMIMISEKEGMNERGCSLIYDGKDHALLYRTSRQIILLDYINPIIKEPLQKQKSVYVNEIGHKGNVLNEYTARVKIVPEIPLDEVDLEPPSHYLKNKEDL